MLFKGQFVLQCVRVSDRQIIVTVNTVQVAAPGELNRSRQRETLVGNAMEDVLAEFGIIE